MNSSEVINDDNLRFLFREYLQRMGCLVGDCISSEVLVDYHKDKLSDDEKSSVVEHLVFCEPCREFALALKFSIDLESIEVAAANTESLGMVGFTNRNKPSHMFLVPIKQAFVNVSSLLWSLRKGAVLASVCLISLTFVWYACQPNVNRLSKFELDRPELTQVRNGSSMALTEGLKFIKAGEFRQARDTFGALMRDDITAYEANCYIGLSYLLEAQHSVLGIKWVNVDKVDKGIESLKQAAALASNRVNQTDLAECLLLLGKAYLLKGDTAQAFRELQAIEVLDQSSAELIKIKKESANLVAALTRAN